MDRYDLRLGSSQESPLLHLIELTRDFGFLKIKQAVEITKASIMTR